jgi:D-alanyl-D-alanine dipeptidase
LAITLYRPQMLTRISEDDGLILDLRYATADNLTGAPIYARPVALLRIEAKQALMAAAARARPLGLSLKIFDAFRPIEAQWKLWRAVQDRTFVADPRLGGTHPRGVAVDLTLVDAARGNELAMGTGFDAMTPRSGHGALDLDPEAIRNRALLLGLMTASRFVHYEHEWWHYNLPGAELLPLLSASAAPGGPM